MLRAQNILFWIMHGSHEESTSRYHGQSTLQHSAWATTRLCSCRPAATSCKNLCNFLAALIAALQDMWWLTAPNAMANREDIPARKQACT